MPGVSLQGLFFPSSSNSFSFLFSLFVSKNHACKVSSRRSTFGQSSVSIKADLYVPANILVLSHKKKGKKRYIRQLVRSNLL